MNGLIVMRGRENVWEKDTPRKEVGQRRKCGQGRRKATEFIKVMLFSKESPSRPPCPQCQQRNGRPIVLVSHGLMR